MEGEDLYAGGECKAFFDLILGLVSGLLRGQSSVHRGQDSRVSAKGPLPLNLISTF